MAGAPAGDLHEVGVARLNHAGAIHVQTDLVRGAGPGGRHCLPFGDVGDTAMPQVEQVLHRRPRARHIVANDRVIARGAVVSPQHDDRHATGQVLEPSRVHQRRHRDKPVDQPVRE